MAPTGGHFCVIDLETTGLYNADRIVEIALVVLDGATLEIVDEYDTLVNPMRDVGPTGRHGITASMVSAAPTFEEIAGTVARIVDGATLVAHNLVFDGRFLTNEFERHGVAMDAGSGVCTLKLSGSRLEQASAAFGIELQHAHQALADAR